MAKITVAVVQSTTPDNQQAAIKHFTHLLQQADRRCDLLALPETANFMRLRDAQQVVTAEQDDPFLHWLQQQAKVRQQLTLAGSLVVTSTNNDTRNFNRSLLIAPSGKIVARYDKIHLFDATVGEQERYLESSQFHAGDRAVVVELPWGRLGLTVCYDLRQPKLFRRLARAGAQVIAVPSAFTRPTGRAHWQILLQARAIENGVFIIAPAQCGTHADGRKTWGHSMVVAPDGKILAQLGADPGVAYVEMDLQHVSRQQQQIPALQHERDFTLDLLASN